MDGDNDEHKKKKRPAPERQHDDDDDAAAKNGSNNSDDNDVDDDNDDAMQDSDNDDEDDRNDETNNDNNKRPSGAKKSKTISRLSKWAARLFDPNRPRGIIEPPAIIPLNDEYLQAFGRREKATDKARGMTALDIDTKIESDDDDEDSLFGDTAAAVAAENRDATGKAAAESDSKKTSGAKVKINNLKYTTTEATLQAACAQFGELLEVKLIMDNDDKNNDANAAAAIGAEGGGRNAGRAYVTFVEDDAAQACIDKLQSLDGRPLRIEVAANRTSRNRNSAIGGGGGGGGGPGRYWERDISTKCFRCGEVGHREAECNNEAKANPCPLCGSTEHEMRYCRNKATCFNCGIPGHVSRECQERRGLPPRRICTVCFRSDHDKTICQEQGLRPEQSTDAICMSCGKRGHHLCQQLQWYFGLTGTFCGNCGQAGHIGRQCQLPVLEECSRHEDVAHHQIQLATELSQQQEQAAPDSNHHQQQQQQQRNRGRRSFDGPPARRGGFAGGEPQSRRRGQSVPPPPRRQNSGGGGGRPGFPPGNGYGDHRKRR